MPEMQGWFNISKLVTVFYHIYSLKQEELHINRYRKAFDKIQYPFMIRKIKLPKN